MTHSTGGEVQEHRAQVVLKNKYGLHARPCTLIAQTAKKFESQVFLGKDGTEVDAKSQANEKGIKAGDIIVEMDLTKVTKPAEISDLLKKAEQGRKTSVLLLVQRGEDRRFVALRIGG